MNDGIYSDWAIPYVKAARVLWPDCKIVSLSMRRGAQRVRVFIQTASPARVEVYTGDYMRDPKAVARAEWVESVFCESHEAEKLHSLVCNHSYGVE